MPMILKGRSIRKGCAEGVALVLIGVDRSRDLSLPKAWVQDQLRIEAAYENMGCSGTSSCVERNRRSIRGGHNQYEDRRPDDL